MPDVTQYLNAPELAALRKTLNRRRGGTGKRKKLTAPGVSDARSRLMNDLSLLGYQCITEQRITRDTAWRFDLVIVDWGFLAIEINGSAWHGYNTAGGTHKGSHSHPEKIDRDRLKARGALAHGWIALAFSTDECFNNDAINYLIENEATLKQLAGSSDT